MGGLALRSAHLRSEHYYSLAACVSLIEEGVMHLCIELSKGRHITEFLLNAEDM
jgi:hypothetical protein